MANPKHSSAARAPTAVLAVFSWAGRCQAASMAAASDSTSHGATRSIGPTSRSPGGISRGKMPARPATRSTVAPISQAAPWA
eukprot:scaffold16550_cov115-Isochrysis_galbana.AAC.3